MKQILEKKLLEYISSNHPDLLIELQAEQNVSGYLRGKINPDYAIAFSKGNSKIFE